MGYTTIRDVRRIIGYDPKFIQAKSIGTGDGSNKNFYIPNKNIVDWNGDDIVDLKDITVYVNGSSVTIANLYPEKGQIILTTAPTNNAVVTADYAYSDLPDSEIQREIDIHSEIINRKTFSKYGRDNQLTQYWDGDGLNKIFYFDRRPVYSIVSYQIDDTTSGLVENTDYWLKPDPSRAQWIEFLNAPTAMEPSNVKLVYKYGETDAIVSRIVELQAAKTILRNEMQRKGKSGWYSQPADTQEYATPSKSFTLYRLLEEEIKSLVPLLSGTLDISVVD